MKHLKLLKEYTNHDFRNDMTAWTKIIHQNKSKYFYTIVDGSVEKWIIPEEYRGEFEEVYTGGDYGTHFKDTGEFIDMVAEEINAQCIIMDYEINDFYKSVEDAINSDGEMA